MKIPADMIELFRAELELCKVGPGEVVAILSQGFERADYAQAFMMAARELGANYFNVNMPPIPVTRGRVGGSELPQNQQALQSLKTATIVIDLVGLLFSHEQNELMANGTRVLMVLEPFDVLQNLLPTPDLRRRVEAAERRLAKATSLRITSDAGTDITYRLTQYPVLTEYGYTDTPGRWDHWPSGMVITSGDDDGVNGTIMVMPGDIWQAFRRYVESPVKLTVRDGFVVDIEGSGFDAELIRSYVGSFNDPKAYAMSHVGWGLNPDAKWHQLAETRGRDSQICMNAISYYGNVLPSLGPNTEVGGTNDTLCHLDFPMRNCNLFLDEEPIVLKGNVIPEDMRVG